MEIARQGTGHLNQQTIETAEFAQLCEVCSKFEWECFRPDDPQHCFDVETVGEVSTTSCGASFLVVAAQEGSEHTLVMPNSGFFSHHLSFQALTEASKNGCELCSLLWIDYLNALGVREQKEGGELSGKHVCSQLLCDDRAFAEARTREPPVLGTSGNPIGAFYLSVQRRDFKIKDKAGNDHYVSGRVVLRFQRDTFEDQTVGPYPTCIITPPNGTVSAFFILGTRACENFRLDITDNLHSFADIQSRPADQAFLEGRIFGRHFVGPRRDFAIARSWIDECVSDHDCNVTVIDTIFPKRLVQPFIEEGLLFAKVVETNQQSTEYVYLSYTWGSTQREVTTVKNYADRLQGFLAESLPKVFLEALLATGLLGYKYIWIDALCIIQDDPNDRDQEIARMSGIYANGIVTIAAKVDSGESFLRSPKTDLERCCMMQYRDSSGITRSEVSIWAQFLAFCTDGFEQAKKSPLESRGWILQERLMSKRVLYLGCRQMDFECAQLQFTDALQLARPVRPRDEQSEAVVFKPNLALNTFSKDQLFRLWRNIVEEYTHRRLSIAADKLPAIAGLADWFSRKLECKYLAGIWEDDLILSLTWKINNYGLTPSERAVVEDASGQYSAPSWSWASPRVHHKPVQFPGQGLGRVFKPQALLINANVELSSGNPFSAVENVVLRMKGKVINGVYGRVWDAHRHNHVNWNFGVNYLPAKNDPSCMRFEYDLDLGSDSCDCDFRLPAEVKVLESWPCVAFLLYVEDEVTNRYARALVLTAAPGEDAYHRIGILQGYWSKNISKVGLKSLFENAQEKQISLI